MTTPVHSGSIPDTFFTQSSVTFLMQAFTAAISMMVTIMVNDSASLSNGLDLESAGTKKIIGLPTDTINDDMPVAADYSQYSKYGVANKQDSIAKQMQDKEGDTLKQLEAKLSAWGTVSSLLDQKLTLFQTPIENRNKGNEQQVQLDQGNMQGNTGIGSSVVGLVSFVANLFSQPMGG